MNIAINIVLFLYGYFSISGQTLLFREYLVAFNGNEMGISAFFVSWPLWIAIGASSRKFIKIETPKSFSFLLLYIPFLVIEWGLILNIRKLAGISAWELFPFGKLTLITFIINSPVSFLTGLFFPLISEMIKKQNVEKPVAWVYIMEGLGAFAGGIIFTLLLYLELHVFHIFLIFAYMLVLAVGICGIKRSKIFSIVLSVVFEILIIVAFFTINVGDFYAYKKNLILPGSRLITGKTTPMAEYLVLEGSGNQKIVVQNGRIAETWPEKEMHSKLTATIFGQNPKIENILVIGTNASLAKYIAQTTGIKSIFLYSSDTNYHDLVFKKIFKEKSPKITIIRNNFWGYLKKNDVGFDAVLNLAGPPLTGSDNGFYTKEFFEDIKFHLTKRGFILTTAPGPSNYAGQELARMGASIYKTLEAVFKYHVIKPGDNSWIISSDWKGLATAASTMETRFKRLPYHEKILLPKTFHSMFEKSRMDFTASTWEKFPGKTKNLINTREKPRGHFFSMLLLGKYSNSPLTKFLNKFRFLNLYSVLFPLFIGLIFIAFYSKKSADAIKFTRFRAKLIVFGAGLCSMLGFLTILTNFQINYGTGFHYIGLFTSLFMIGLLGGAILSRYIQSGHEGLFRITTGGCVFVFVVFVMASLLIQFYSSNLLLKYSNLCFVLGAITGFVFPLCEVLMNSSGLDTSQTGNLLEKWDHLGALFGSILGGLFFIPIIGTKGTFIIIISIYVFLLFANLLKFLPKKGLSGKSSLLGTGFLFCWILFMVVFVRSFLLEKEKSDLSTITQEDLRQLGVKPSQHLVQKDDFFVVHNEKNGEKSFVISSNDYAPQVPGYGGPISIIMKISERDVLESYFVKDHQETPWYFKKTLSWFKKLAGKKIQNIGMVDAVTGATVTSQAIKNTMMYSFKSFSQKRKIISVAPPIDYLKYSWFVFAICIAVVLMKITSPVPRLVWLGVNLIVGGVIYNLQFSTDQIAILSGMNFSLSSPVFLFVWLIPFLVFLFGNFFCGNLCPFGALQEFLEKFGLARPVEEKQLHKRARVIKFAIFFAVMIAFALTGSRELFSFDPLTHIFSFGSGGLSLYIAMAVLLMSFIVPRFWCRYLCPTGAFLAIVSFFKPLSWIFPRKKYKFCPYKVENNLETDCLECNRCLKKKL